TNPFFLLLGLLYCALFASYANKTILRSCLLDCFASLEMTAGKAVGATDVTPNFFNATGSYGRFPEKSSRLAANFQVSSTARPLAATKLSFRRMVCVSVPSLRAKRSKTETRRGSWISSHSSQ
ncbi:MAG: hypothetical protein ACHQIO_11475, partial [Nevskiales bacterium]